MKKIILGTLATLILAVGALTVYAATMPTSASDVNPAVMWENDYAEVYRLRALNEAGTPAESFEPFALRTLTQLLEEIGRLVEIEAHHHEMSRDELVQRASIVTTIMRATMSDEASFDRSGFFGWVRENYTAGNVAIYEEMGAPQWFIDRLVDEISLRLQGEDAEVYRLRALNDAGASADEFEPFALWTRAELLEQIGMATDVEARHHIMSRDELVLRASVAITVMRTSRITEAAFEGTGFFEWARENYTEENIAIYEEMGAPQWLVNRLRAEISVH